MSRNAVLACKAAGAVLLATAGAAAFAAYLQPGMLIEFANLVLCM